MLRFPGRTGGTRHHDHGTGTYGARMTEEITPGTFHAAEGVEDWRVVFEGACAASLRPVGRAVRPSTRGSRPTCCPCGGPSRLRAGRRRGPADPRRRGPAIWCRPLREPGTERNRVHVDVSAPHGQTAARVAAGVAAGGRIVSDRYARARWAPVGPLSGSGRFSRVGRAQVEPASQVADLAVDGRIHGAPERHVAVDRRDAERPASRSARASSFPTSRSPYRIGRA
jgi:hypothetical protein